MKNYKSNAKNFNRQNIFERFSTYKQQKLKIENSITAINNKIDVLKNKYASEISKLPSEIDFEKCVDLQNQLNHYENKLSNYEKQQKSLIPIAKNLKKTFIKIGSFIVASSLAIGGLVSSCSKNNSNNVSIEPSTSFSDNFTEPESPTVMHISEPESTTRMHISEPNFDQFLDTIAQKFIDLYSNPNRTPLEQRQLENYSAEIINKTDYLKGQIFERLNEEYCEKLDIDEIHSVEASIFNYDSGHYQGIVSFNSADPVMSHNNSDILAGSIVDKKYSTNVDLANARIAAYTIQSIDPSIIENVCIVTDKNGKATYNFNLSNNAPFRAAAKQILENNIDYYKDEMREIT